MTLGSLSTLNDSFWSAQCGHSVGLRDNWSKHCSSDGSIEWDNDVGEEAHHVEGWQTRRPGDKGCFRLKVTDLREKSYEERVSMTIKAMNML